MQMTAIRVNFSPLLKCHFCNISLSSSRLRLKKQLQLLAREDVVVVALVGDSVDEVVVVDEEEVKKTFFSSL